MKNIMIHIITNALFKQSTEYGTTGQDGADAVSRVQEVSSGERGTALVRSTEELTAQDLMTTVAPATNSIVLVRNWDFTFYSI